MSCLSLLRKELKPSEGHAAKEKEIIKSSSSVVVVSSVAIKQLVYNACFNVSLQHMMENCKLHTCTLSEIMC